MKKGARRNAKRPGPVASFDWSLKHITICPDNEVPFVVSIPNGSWELIKGDAKTDGLGLAQFFACELSSSARCAWERVTDGGRVEDPLYCALLAREESEPKVIKIVTEFAS